MESKKRLLKILNVQPEVIRTYSSKWKVREFALFGSILGGNFSEISDVDVLITFEEDADITLFDLVRMSSELEAILKRKVDLVSKSGLDSSRNHLRRNAILNSAELIYAA